MKVLGIIPARYESVRFPGKPLADIAGQPMIRRVYERAQLASLLDRLIVATDNADIFETVTSFGGEAIMTSSTCRNGTERCAELADKLEEHYDLIINIQGDEPVLVPDQIDLIIQELSEDSDIATLAHALLEEEKRNSNIVKVALDRDKVALGFSRDHDFIQNISQDIYKHIGLYGFKQDILKKVVQLQATPNELFERLEQLRWLDHGYRIKVGITTHQNFSVDVPEDVQKIIEVLKNE